MLVLDSGGLSLLASHQRSSVALIRELMEEGLWPPVVPTVVLVESLLGDPRRDAPTNQFLKTCEIEDSIAPGLARRAAELRRRAGTGSAVDAIVVASAEPGGTVLTGDKFDIESLASYADDVAVEAI